jgi:hypothetical protein
MAESWDPRFHRHAWVLRQNFLVLAFSESQHTAGWCQNTAANRANQSQLRLEPEQPKLLTAEEFDHMLPRILTGTSGRGHANEMRQ